MRQTVRGQRRGLAHPERRHLSGLVIQKIVISIILTTIIIIAAINVLASLSMTVLSKVRNRHHVVPGRPAAIWRVFISRAARGLLGTALRSAGTDGLRGLHQYGYNLDAKVYNIAEMPIRLSADGFIAGVTQIICLLAGLAPAARAAKTKPIRGLRHG